MERLFFLSFLVGIVQATTCGTCNSAGTCATGTGICTCFAGYTGYQCEHRTCPQGTAWADYATATDTAHANAECSNMGICDRTTGTCTCSTGFEGVACERMSCPTCTNGRCVSMREAAALQDDRNFFVTTTYTLWDADKVYGCMCDFGYSGHDCSKKDCPKGDDPGTTGQLDEIQRVNCLCDGCAGTFTLTFRGETTANIAFGASLATFETALEALRTVNDVTVSLSGAGSTVCDSNGATVSVTFIKNPGNLPSMIATSSLTGGTSALTVSDAGADNTYDTSGVSVDGTREYLDCSDRGSCALTTGTCTCDTNFASSDGAGASGALGDCGFGSPTACPTTTIGECDLHGTCSGTPQWGCTCVSGYQGHDCSQLVCPTAKAWFDGASAADTAHAAGTTCSNKGNCDTDTGLCTCDDAFTGSSCNLLKCPGTTTCTSHGNCKTMQELAALSASNGDLLGVTYGNTANLAATWDFDMIQGCHCSTGYYMGPYIGTVSDYQAYDCTLLSCPYGDDPVTTGKVNEQQTISCTADGGTFTVTFRQQTTAAIAYNANAAAVKAALEALSTITSVTVTFSAGVVACTTGTIGILVEFTYEQGALPAFTVSSASLTASSGSVALTVAETVAGTKNNLECSRRGLCDRTTGQCGCYEGFLSSDGAGAVGTRGDCGYKSAYSTL